ncbi:UDP-forming cellulose synthase catalytic subunit [Pseudomonas syringae]|uniref:Cellulose synthase catalytic subunit [UDP-forming] n=1 Tax=Pseudomonas syringae TaxID=317 RepID=A0A9Q4A5Q1_PSESX|nr:UDP-forming cellulose synthase catalytic subunit [Pseudomonas syringae]MCF5470890.1 UDP-forming cellulose synthase catalytic subunit [Pseudomonas syringae]MCF5475732.1 UDP-forming cellulose synthase catalytic subunit [Pseudomonas syringae]MCF5485673.1 UDP-forming cellulose synthase catalytic subunit [Pseudomonas syringae]MCF5490172.1 UDP-forming cellulose synthase catalytic subunit [Pseudomonas syringae]MCF5494688.1 UDP-forming cellulose synthase catalytic subunit [Pseudomonas syringae]
MTNLSLDASAPRTRTPSWLNALLGWFGSLSKTLRRVLKITSIVVGLLLMLLVVTAPLDLTAQCFFALACFAAMLLIRKIPGRLSVLALVTLSLLASFRYMYWRLTSTLDFENWLDSLLGYGLIVAEFYTLIVIVLGYVQTAWPLHRKPVIMPSDSSQWPTVDVFIPSYNEALSIVKLTIFAAQSIDWPRDKLRVYVLDDGRREDFREFCEQIGVGYLTRDNNHHAKAGNLNEALKSTDGEYIAMFDADHVPTRSFLQVAMGWFLKDAKLAMLQTPHFFFSPDAFEKNLDTFRTVPNEGELFYGLLQDGNDLWNATFFCGSCAVLRRSSLLEIGGVATETVTEDAHTALKLNRAGYNTAYLAIPQAAGLATESLSRHVAQRIRWARGMAQIFRTDNPLLGKGLSLGQRLCYANAMLHFFYGLPRLVFLTAPLAYLLFGAEVMHASALMITAYVLPHLAHASLTNSKIQGRFRHSFWNEVYEAVLAWYIMGPVLMAMINPKFGGFNVTDKGGVVEETFFDWALARPYIVLLTLNAVVFVLGIYSLYQLGWNNDAITLTIVINMAWTLYNIIITSAAIAVASEIRQVRTEPRVQAKLPIRVTRADGVMFNAVTQDFSQTGLGLLLPAGSGIDAGDSITVSLYRGAQVNEFPATVMFCRDGYLGTHFGDLSLRQQSELVRLTFGRADTWASTWGHGKPDSPLAALREVSHIGVRGVIELLKATRKDFSRLLPTRKRPSPPPAN